jgi:DNA polymerase-1
MPPLTTKDGVQTGACKGFVNMLSKILKQEPSHIAVAFDCSRSTFRHRMYDKYKISRDETPLALLQQFPLIKRMLQAYGISFFENPDFEADDLIGTLATMFAPEIPVTIISGDKDLLQLVSENVTVSLTRTGGAVPFTAGEDVLAQYNLWPHQFPDFKALAGDSGDNIPGVPGIGEKIAVKLLQEYGSLETLLNCRGDLSAKLCAKLEYYDDHARLCKKLGTIVKDIFIVTDLDELAYKGPDQDALTSIFRELEFRNVPNS